MIKDAFKNGKAFIPFITAGDPDLETTAALIKEMEKAGADIIELGIPFSDPTAEGPVIQEANLRSLSGGVTTDKIIEMAGSVKAEVKVPLVFMTYANVVYSYKPSKDGFAVNVSYNENADTPQKAVPPRAAKAKEPGQSEENGTEAFAKAAAKAGINGIILADVSFEEKQEFAPVFGKYGIEFISLIAPTSEERIEKIAKDAEGFVYCVSSLGVTGVRDSITTDIGKMISHVRKVNPEIPCAVGFGISKPEQARDMCEKSDGAIVGSAIVKIIAKYGKDCVPHVADYVREMKEACGGRLPRN